MVTTEWEELNRELWKRVYLHAVLILSQVETPLGQRQPLLINLHRHTHTKSAAHTGTTFMSSHVCV